MKNKAKETFTCLRCKKTFSTQNNLKAHNRKHLEQRSPDEIRLLEKGHIPDKTKLGSEFKGKNKIIIS